jgi:hypothetical protein
MGAERAPTRPVLEFETRAAARPVKLSTRQGVFLIFHSASTPVGTKPVTLLRTAAG